MKLRPQDKERLSSKEWRMSHFYKIKDKKKKLVTFKRNKAQRDFEKNKHSRNIILKSRQLGFTTDESVDTLDDMAFVRNYDALFIAHNLDSAKDIFDNKIKLAWDNYALKDKYDVDLNSARRLKVGFGKNKDGEEMHSSITVDTSGRSGTYSRLHISEFAKLCKTFPDRAKEVISGSIPAIPTNGRVDVESTADGASGKFYEMFWKAWDRGEPKLPTQFKSHFYNWQWDEEIETQQVIDVPREFKNYQERFRLTDKEISYYYTKFCALGEDERDWQTMKKEYPTTPEEAFESSGKKLFDNEALGLLQIKQPIKEYNGFRIFKEYKLGHTYGMGCDVAEGIGQDSSTMVLWDFSPAKPEVVAEYDNNQIAPDLFAYEIKNLAEKYEYPLVAIERNNHGHTTISKLRDIYPDRHIYKDVKDRYGWLTNLVNKPTMMYNLNTAVNEELVEISSSRIISEARRYDKEDLRILKGTEETQHWDLLVGCAIGFQMKNHAGAVRRKKRQARNQITRGRGIFGV